MKSKKEAWFKALTKTRKQVFLNFMTTFGLFQNEYSLGLVSQNFTIDVLFEKL